MRIINLYGGAGTGKSSTAADLFALMKWKNYSVELVDEYAKQLTWDGHQNILRDQIYVFAKQNRKLERLRGKVDWIITDSPLLLGTIYTYPDYYKNFQSLVHEVNASYQTVDVFLERVKPYDPNGRNQTELEAMEKDIEIKQMLDILKIPYHTIKANPDAKYRIMEILENE